MIRSPKPSPAPIGPVRKWLNVIGGACFGATLLVALWPLLTRPAELYVWCRGQALQVTASTVAASAAARGFLLSAWAADGSVNAYDLASLGKCHCALVFRGETLQHATFRWGHPAL